MVGCPLNLTVTGGRRLVCGFSQRKRNGSIPFRRFGVGSQGLMTAVGSIPTP